MKTAIALIMSITLVGINVVTNQPRANAFPTNKLLTQTSLAANSKQESAILFPILKNGKWGFIDKNGKVIVKPKYDEVRNFSEGLAAVKIGNKLG
ncbi:MAG: WG repeat-containing protein, partial [Microcoleaceae cyanobacterium]